MSHSQTRMITAKSLQIVLKLTVDEALHKQYHSYQDQPPTDYISFPSVIRMFPWNDIDQLSQFIYNETRILSIHQRLFFRGREVTAYRKNKGKTAPSLSYFGITDGSTIYLQCSFASESTPIVPYGNSIKCDSLIKESISGLKAGLSPILSEDGEGGTYFLLNGNNKYISCFKPCDEEAGASNNPRGRSSVSGSFHCGIKPCFGHLREIAAYLFDCLNGNFHGVPPTYRVEIGFNSGFNYNNNIYSSKIGSLQSFVEGEVIENFGVKNFSIREIHKIGILDILLLNSDRNSGNVLVSKIDSGRRYSLIPIDHGLSLPKCIEITADSWVWMNWNQSSEPFEPYTIDYINNIDIDSCIVLLRNSLNLEEIVFENMRISHLVLKKGAMRGLTLNQIGSIIARPNYNTKSILEELMVQAESLSKEKVRQNKHLINRINKKKRKKITQKQIKVIKTPNTFNIAMCSLTPEPFNDDDDKYPFWTPNYKIKNNNDDIPSFQLETDDKEEKDDMFDSPIQKTSSIHDRPNIESFSAVNIESLIKSRESHSSVFLYGKEDNNMVPLARSTSCIDTSSSSTTTCIDSFDIKSASLINDKSMIDTRNKALNNGCIKEEGDDDNDSICIVAESPSNTSHQSQDDLINKPQFVIHPIMERMAKENNEVNKYFLYYLDQLLGIQCERISNRSRKSDDTDNIYDIDTVEGSFIWKNELRKHWIRSRLERKKLMAPKPPTNPFKNKNKEKEIQIQIEIQQQQDDEDDGNDWFGAEGTVDYDDDDDDQYL